jgi:phage shock protein PspC (stress-responsive transcriptional regulator)
MTIKTATPRDDLLGICHATAQTFGFDPIVLRVLLMLGLLLDFEAAVLAYAVLGLAVLAASLLAPAPRRVAAA